LTAAPYGRALRRGRLVIRAFIIIAITAAAGLVLAAAFIGHAGLPLTLAAVGLALGVLVAAFIRRE
jgi:hypothetical protein